MYSRSRSLQASGLLAGTKPSKVAVRFSLTDWLLVVLVVYIMNDHFRSRSRSTERSAMHVPVGIVQSHTV